MVEGVTSDRFYLLRLSEAVLGLVKTPNLSCEGSLLIILIISFEKERKTARKMRQ
jgi:hypothetical protein